MLSQTAKNQLTQLKRNTKIDQWNILCRWAFCRSLAEPSIPS
ncbi:MAG: DndE family protein, partial [Hormoscilla sp. GM102CHS1]|nr:DndE family protein [Hormoscilla sp. GM102CHS1]